MLHGNVFDDLIVTAIILNYKNVGSSRYEYRIIK